MNADNMVMIGAQMIHAEAKIKLEDSIEDRLKAAMKVGRNHWMITDEDQRFRASCGAVLLDATEEERERIGDELHNLRVLNALITGVSSNIDAMREQENPIGLLKLWKDD